MIEGEVSLIGAIINLDFKSGLWKKSNYRDRYPRRCGHDGKEVIVLEKQHTMKDGSQLMIRELKLADLDHLMDFYVSLPHRDRKYLRIDVTDRELVKQRIIDAENKKDIRLAAWHDGKIIGTGALELGRDDWKKDIGELRLIIAKEFQRKGVGTLLATEIYHQAAEKGVQKLVVKMLRPQKAAQSIFKRLGFDHESVVPDYVFDQLGRSQDLLIMTSNMENFWKELEHIYNESDWRRCR